MVNNDVNFNLNESFGGSSRGSSRRFLFRSFVQTLSATCSIIAFVMGNATINAAVSPPSTVAGPTRVGNGDDGGDLEGAQKVTSGILVETQREAVQLLRSLQVQGIEGLGTLIPETEKADIFLAQQEPSPTALTATESQSDLEEVAQSIGAREPYVYARTFREPHASTRFFPKALLLDRKSLIALHVHEALHRALSEELSGNERAVGRITLALTSEGATRDRVQEVIRKETEQSRAAKLAFERDMIRADATSSLATVVSDSRPQIESPSLLGYSYKSFVLADKQVALSPMRSLHVLRSFLYPFGQGAEAVGVGVEFSYLQAEQEAYLGPIGLSGRMKVLTWRGFDVDGVAALRMHSVGSQELKDSPLGRDVFEVGINIKRDHPRYFVENKIAILSQSEASQTIGAIRYSYDYGSIFNAGIGAAARIPLFGQSLLEVGASADVLLAENSSFKGGSFVHDTGRMRVVTLGPEVAWLAGPVRASVRGRYIIDSTKGATLDQLGDLLGHGVGQGGIETGLSLRF